MAVGNSTIGDFGAAAQDIFSGLGDQAKASGDFAEATEYNAAAGLALQNEQFTKQFTAIKEAQQQRELVMAQGGIQANQAGSGFRMSGSALDIMRDSASQGALTQGRRGEPKLAAQRCWRRWSAPTSQVTTRSLDN